MIDQKCKALKREIQTLELAMLKGKSQDLKTNKNKDNKNKDLDRIQKNFNLKFGEYHKSLEAIRVEIEYLKSSFGRSGRKNKEDKPEDYMNTSNEISRLMTRVDENSSNNRR